MFITLFIHNLSPGPSPQARGVLLTAKTAKYAQSFNSASPPLLRRGGRGERLKENFINKNITILYELFRIKT